MNPYIASAVAEMNKVPVSRFEHPGDSALDPASCRFVAAFVRALGAKRILEFGSGFSTLMMAREIEAVEGNYLLSIDHLPAYSAAAREALESSGCQAKVDFRVAKLKPRFYGPRLLLTYDLPKGLLAALGPFDLVLIDSPEHNYACEAVFYDAFPAVAEGGYLVLGEANREGHEKVSSLNWDHAYGEDIQPAFLEGIGNGLNVVEKLADGKPQYQLAGAMTVSLKTARAYGRLLLGRGREAVPPESSDMA